MTALSLPLRRMARTSLALALLVLAGCSTAREGRATDGADENTGNASGEDEGDGDGAEDDGSDGDLTEDDGVDACGPAVGDAKDVLERHCASCHGEDSAGEGGFATVLDVEAMVESGIVVADDPENSPLVTRIASGSMPPAGLPKLTPAELDSLRAWIACGAVPLDPFEPAPLEFTPLEARLAELIADLRTLPTPEERLDVRYIELHTLANGGRPEKALADYRDALDYLMNSLSQAPEVAPLVEVGDKRLLLRVRLSAYGWTPETWETLVAGYPYAVRYDPDSRLFPLDDAPAEALRTETGTQVPVVEAGWFLSNAARPPLYHDLLGIPPRLVDLERQLGIDLSNNIGAAAVARAGFSDSGPSRFNRVIERHTLSPERGALWITYDFSASAGTSNIFLHPLDFVPDSNELLFHLPNGFQAFMIVDAAGNRLDIAPSDAVQDELAADRFMVNGISCLSCHATRGIVSVADEVRASTVGAGFSPEDEARILALYRDQVELDELFAGDRQRFQAARTAAAMDRVSDGLLHKIDGRHRDNLDIEGVAAALGVTVEELEAAIDMAGASVPTRIAAMRTVPGSQVPRDSFEALFGELVVALDLGQPIAAQ